MSGWDVLLLKYGMLFREIAYKGIWEVGGVSHMNYNTCYPTFALEIDWRWDPNVDANW